MTRLAARLPARLPARSLNYPFRHNFGSTDNGSDRGPFDPRDGRRNTCANGIWGGYGRHDEGDDAALYR